MSRGLEDVRVGFLGGGAMGEALAGGVLAAGARQDGVRVADPDPVRRKQLEQALGRTLDVLIQVNVSGEAQKGGAAPDALGELAAVVGGCAQLRLRGLMTVPAASEDPEAARPAFARLRELRDALCRSAPGLTLPELSMGMSADLEVAVEEGATIVRVGTALFGPRGQT
jgi:uncharacterized pyridoxal phosphate-containing UPF0001 family protein